MSRLPGFLEEVCSRTSARRQQMHGFQSSSCCLHANFVELYRTRAIADQKFYAARIWIVDYLCSCDLDLDPMTFIYELDPYPLEREIMLCEALPAFPQHMLPLPCNVCISVTSHHRQGDGVTTSHNYQSSVIQQ